ncbi:hypothetical protein BC938DRAFT_472578, partial [Jimgerdemannia flammicorona]
QRPQSPPTRHHAHLHQLRPPPRHAPRRPRLCPRLPPRPGGPDRHAGRRGARREAIPSLYLHSAQRAGRRGLSGRPLHFLLPHGPRGQVCRLLSQRLYRHRGCVQCQKVCGGVSGQRRENNGAREDDRGGNE